MLDLEAKHNQPIKRIVIDTLAGRSMAQAAQELGVSRQTLYSWLARLGIQRGWIA